MVVDASGSMGGALTALARRITEAALREAYLARTDVAMVAFRGTGSALLFGPTRRVERIHSALRGLEAGGTTPLAAGLWRAGGVLRAARRREREQPATLLLISDGRANVGDTPGCARLWAEVQGAAEALARCPALHRVMLDATPAGREDGPAAAVAGWLGARRVRLHALGGLGADPASLLKRSVDVSRRG